MTVETSEERAGQPRSWLERKLEAIERKLDHIIYRLREEDPRTQTRTRPAAGRCIYGQNHEWDERSRYSQR